MHGSLQETSAAGNFSIFKTDKKFPIEKYDCCVIYLTFVVVMFHTVTATETQHFSKDTLDRDVDAISATVTEIVYRGSIVLSQY